MIKYVRKCPICSSKKNKKIYRQEFANNLFHIISACNRCGFVFVSNSPDQKYYDNYYKTMSKYEHERDEILHQKYCEIISQYCRKDVRILDIGCSTGHLLYQLKKIGYNNIYGIDPSPKCKELAKKNFKIKINTSSLFSFKARNKFDLLIFAAVFEHLDQIRKAVDRAQSLLSENGYIFISVPDTRGFSTNSEEPFGEFSIEHINFFSTKDLFNLLDCFMPLYIVSDGKVIYSLWKKMFKTSNSVIKYINQSKKKQLIINRRIKKFPKKIIVWGAGSLTQRLLGQILIKSKVLKLVDRDNNLIGKTLNGISIISPQEVRGFKEPILIASFRFREEIKKEIENMALKNEIITFQ